ncbi:MAG TPA: hypothetical protein VGM88_12010 [Kofleriaceae bacterium]
MRVIALLALGGTAMAQPAPPAPFAVPPPDPPWTARWVYAVGVGLGGVSVDHKAAGCSGCSDQPPAITMRISLARRLSPVLALGGFLAAEVQFVDDGMDDSRRFGLIHIGGYAEYAMTPRFQLLGGLGYGYALYNYDVTTAPDFLGLGGGTETEEDDVGGGVTGYAALRIVMVRGRQVACAIEPTITLSEIPHAGTVSSFEVNIAAGNF